MNSLYIKVAARSSPLSRAQVEEVYAELKVHYPQIIFEPVWIETTGDRDLMTSLRTLDKTDFFTKEIDALLLQGGCRIAIHSAKDLPDPLPSGLQLVALTRGVDPSDALVLRCGERLETLPHDARIGTSSERREAAIHALCPTFRCVDMRGTIQQRLTLLEKRLVDGLVVAEAAILRLNLVLNRFFLPRPTAPLQGRLAIIARADDAEMERLWKKINVIN